MTFNVSSPITGMTQTGFTSPTYTMIADTPPANNAKQWAVTALGGTQAGVIAHSVSAPFTLAAWRPSVYKTLGPVDPVTGILRSIPMNVYKVIARKGVLPLAGQAYRPAQLTVLLEVPAGADLADPANIRALQSMAFGAIASTSAGLGDTTISGLL